MTTIKIIENGPALISTNDGSKIIIEANDGQLVTEKTAICRCGNSKNQPYCDGSHKSKTEQGDL